MVACDVLVAGGGPAGATCAGMLRRAGLDVVVMDRARFPRDKVCAGWITPQVIAALGALGVLALLPVALKRWRRRRAQLAARSE